MERICIVTGSASGIGAATTAMLRDDGATVIGLDLRDAEVLADLSSPETRRAGAREALDRAGGRVDAVIACAGISAPVSATAAVNYFGVVDVLEELRPALAKSRAPRAVAVSSMSSLQTVAPPLVERLLAGDEGGALEIAEGLAADPQTANLIYASSKRALSRWIRREAPTPAWAGAGIPLNAVAPGVVETPMTEGLLATPETTAFVDAVVPMPLNYHQPAASIASLLVWLASEANTHCAGQTIYCDGGADVVLRGDDAWSWADEAVSAKLQAAVAGLAS